MFQGFDSSLLSFYADIRFNNNKAFMDEHRKEYYQKVRDPFYAFIDELAPVMLAIDGEIEVRPHKCLSRINRDTRFSNDKSPYRDHHWLAFRKAACSKDGMPFYWFEIRLDSISWGLGVWGENRNLFDAMRRKMTAAPDEWLQLMAIAAERDFAPGGLRWKKIKPPEGLPVGLLPVYPAKELYFEKQHIEPSWIFEPDIVRRVAEDFKALAPLWRALHGLDTTEGGNL